MSDEKSLQELLAVSRPGSWSEPAKQWQKAGKKVVGIIDSYVPEEVLFAGGLLPVRIMHVGHKYITLAAAYRVVHTDAYYTNVLEAALKKELPFVDGYVFTNRDDDARRLYDVFEMVVKPPLVHLMHIPRVPSAPAITRLSQEIDHLSEVLQNVWGVRVSDAAIRRAAETYNKTRQLIGKLYEWRKRDVPPLTGTEFLQLTTAGLVMPRDVFNARLEALMPFLEKREANIKNPHPRLLVSSDSLDSWKYIELVENSGALVAMDDLDTGSRYYTLETDLKDPDIKAALAIRYLNRPACPRMASWERQIEYIIQLVHDYRCDGVVELPLRNSFAREYRVPILAKALENNKIPSVSLKREYDYSNEAQLSTRIGSFIEMLGAGAAV